MRHGSHTPSRLTRGSGIAGMRRVPTLRVGIPARRGNAPERQRPTRPRRPTSSSRRAPSVTVLIAYADVKRPMLTVQHRRATVKQWRAALRGPNAAQKHPTHRSFEGRASPSKT